MITIRVTMYCFHTEVETGFLTVVSGENLENFLIPGTKDVLVFDPEEIQEEKIITSKIENKRSIGDQDRTPEIDSAAIP